MVSKVVYLRGLFLQDPSAEGRHTAQEEAIELECKMQWLKKKKHSSQSWEEMSSGPGLEESTDKFKWKQ